MDNSKLAVLAAVVAIGVGAVALKSRSKPKEPEKEETWESHIPCRCGRLEEIRPNLYRLEAAGCQYGPPTRNMTIYQVPDDSKRLVIVSAIAVGEEILEEILLLGTPSILMVPNTMHRCCAGVWKKRFPDLRVVCPDFGCPKDGRATVEQVVPVDWTTDQLCQHDEWKDWLTVRRIDGWAHFEEVLEVQLANQKKAMIVCDLLFTMTRETDAGWFSRIRMLEWAFDSCIDAPLPGKLTVPKVSRVARLFGILDWKKAEAWYRNYSKEHGANIVAIMVGHGPPIVELKEGEGCAEALDGVAMQLTKPRW